MDHVARGRDWLFEVKQTMYITCIRRNTMVQTVKPAYELKSSNTIHLDDMNLEYRGRFTTDSHEIHRILSIHTITRVFFSQNSIFLRFITAYF